MWPCCCLCVALPYVPWAASVVALRAAAAWGCRTHDVAKLHAFVSLGFTRSGAAPAALSLCEGALPAWIAGGRSEDVFCRVSRLCLTGVEWSCAARALT